MKRLHALIFFMGVFCVAFSAFPQESTVIGSAGSTASKELKRSARRLNIPVEQLKKARRVLQEATDLAKQIKPLPVSHISGLIGAWQHLNHSNAKELTDYFLKELRSEAANAADFNTYIQATLTALSFVQSYGDASDYEKALELIRSWPQPEAAGEPAADFLRSQESGIRQNAILMLSNTDPEKAKALLSQTSDFAGRQYSISGQIAQGLIHKGKTEEALAFVNQIINDFSQHASDPQAVQEYQSFIQSTIYNLGSGAGNAMMAPLIAQMAKQTPTENCTSGTIKSKTGTTSVDLTCSEWDIFNLARNILSMPGLVNTTLNSFPSLKSKLEQAGGIDDAFSYSTAITPRYPGATDTPHIQGPGSTAALDETKANSTNMSNLIKEIMGKAESNPEFVKGRLKEFLKNQRGLEMLVNLAMTTGYRDPDLGSLILEVAKPLVSQVEPIQKRASVLQMLIQAYRQVDGEIEADILRDGFTLTEQLREELRKKSSELQAASDNGNPPDISPDLSIVPIDMPPELFDGTYSDVGMEAYFEDMTASESMDTIRMMAGFQGLPWGSGDPDQMEAFLVSELAKDHYEKAVDFARSRKSETLKLTYLIQIAQTLGNPD
jgi:hypothetical protein